MLNRFRTLLFAKIKENFRNKTIKTIKLINNAMKNYPKIGIRPVIDGRRRGIRESLEQKTMGMAEAVAKFYAEHLRYADGTPVQCVIADTTIGGVG